MNYLDNLNPNQKEAVLHTEGPLLILAGAGSGKTKTLTTRIAYLMDECNVNPFNIMAITFTNKAAKEMKERIEQLVGFGSESIWVCTFHSSCVKILRRFIDRLGYDRNFTIYDTDDQKSVVKDVVKRLDLDSKVYKERSVLNYISSQKNELISADECRIKAGTGNYNDRIMAKLYVEYEEACKRNNAVDFDDLLCLTVQLFKENPDVLEFYQERFRYILVDEYQDTNTAQFELVRMLAAKYENLCVVGDDDQSIYRFRGANIRNILEFEETYQNARVIKLEQNYRSYQNILDAANGVIRHNTGRKNKTLWSDRGDGELVHYDIYNNGLEEATGVVRDIVKKTNGGFSYKDFAVLYRTNAQSRLLEERFVAESVPYRVYGGVNFYQRKEIKDILAYLKTIDNARDDVAVHRIINVPKRGIGATTISKVDGYAIAREINFFEALEYADDIPGLGKAATKLSDFVTFIGRLRAAASTMKISSLIEYVVEETGYKSLIEDEAEDKDEAEDRLNNIQEFINKAVSFEETEIEGDLSQFLEEVALIADVDNLDESNNRVSLMTIHSAKGLEFPVVYLTGMEDGLFPSFMSMDTGNIEDIEEERRLCYVGITRAMNELHMSSAKARMVRGETQYLKESRFMKEIDPAFLETHDMSFGGRSASAGTGRSFGNTGYGQRSFSSEFDGTPFGNASSSASDYAKKAKAWIDKEISKGAPKLSSLDYEVGDIVKHIKFGTGVVRDIQNKNSDFEVSVEFENYGMKKMFASFAKLIKQ